MSFSTFDCAGLGSVGVAGVDGGGAGIGVDGAGDGAGIGVDGAGDGTGSGSAIGVDGVGNGAGIGVDGGRGICCRSCTDDWNCGNDCTLEKKICKQSIMNMHNKYMYIIPVYYLPCLARCFVAETSILG